MLNSIILFKPDLFTQKLVNEISLFLAVFLQMKVLKAILFSNSHVIRSAQLLRLLICRSSIAFCSLNPSACKIIASSPLWRFSVSNINTGRKSVSSQKKQTTHSRSFAKCWYLPCSTASKVIKRLCFNQIHSRAKWGISSTSSMRSGGSSRRSTSRNY